MEIIKSSVPILFTQQEAEELIREIDRAINFAEYQRLKEFQEVLIQMTGRVVENKDG